MLFLVNNNGVPSVASFINLSQPATAPSPPTGVTATAGNGTATVSWSAPQNGGSPLTSYTITPYVSGAAQPATTVSGSPPAKSATITRLTNGTSYTFTVSATNAVGTSAPSAPSNAVTPSTAPPPPAFIQAASSHASSVTSLAVTPGSNITTGDRVIVEVGVWSSGGATAASVTDSAGNKYTELLHFKASENTEMSVWSAPITAGAGTRPQITATPTSSADMGLSALEYSGLSNVSDATVLDQVAHATGTTKTAASVASGPTPATSASNELALGLYADSGFGENLTAGSGYTARTNVSPSPDIEFLSEDQVAGSGATPSASVSTGPNTAWLMATLVFKHS